MGTCIVHNCPNPTEGVSLLCIKHYAQSFDFRTVEEAIQAEKRIKEQKKNTSQNT